MKYQYIFVFILLILFGLYWLAESPYSTFNNRLIKLSDGREVLCKDYPSVGRSGRGVRCYDVTTKYKSDQIFGKRETSDSPLVLSVTLKYYFLQKLWIIFVVIGIAGLARQLGLYRRDKQH